MKRPQLRPQARFLVFATALAFSAGCALFQDLDSNGYTLVDAGSDAGACGADAAFTVGATGCHSEADCTPGKVCCASLNPQAGAIVSCVDSVAACTGMGSVAVQLCATSTECGNGGPCTMQTCTFNGASTCLSACSPVPFCVQ